MNRELQTYGAALSKPVLSYVHFLGKEPNSGLRHVSAHLNGQSSDILEQGKLDLLATLQQTRQTQLQLHAHQPTTDTVSSFAAAEQALALTLKAVNEALSLAARASGERRTKRQSLQPTLDALLPEAKSNDEDFSQWYETLFDSPTKK